MGDAGGGRPHQWQALAARAQLGRVFAELGALADRGLWPVGGAGARPCGDGGPDRFFFGSRGLGEDFDPYPETGWVLAPEFQSRGFGMDAASAAHDWFDRVVAGRTVCMITPEHEGSLRIAQTLGYAPLREAQVEGEAVLLMTRKGPPV